jgi:hypothetical protein
LKEADSNAAIAPGLEAISKLNLLHNATLCALGLILAPLRETPTFHAKALRTKRLKAQRIASGFETRSYS